MAAGATKEVFGPVVHATEITVINQYPIAKLDADGEFAYMSFKVPHDFSSIVSAQIVLASGWNGNNQNLDISASYGAIGEDKATHQENDVASVYDFVGGIWTTIDISGILTALAAGDLVGINLTTHEVLELYVLGVRFRYN